MVSASTWTGSSQSAKGDGARQPRTLGEWAEIDGANDHDRLAIARQQAGPVHVLRDQETGDVGEELALVDDQDIEIASRHMLAHALHARFILVDRKQHHHSAFLGSDARSRAPASRRSP
jgi:hypothetical protein